MIVTLSNNISNLNNAIRNRSLKVNLVKNNLTLNLINLLKERRIIVNFKELDHRYVTVLLKKGLSFKIRMLTKPSRYIYMGYKELNTKSFGNGCWIISTSRGKLMDSYQCLKEKTGGLVLCQLLFIRV